MRWMTILLGLLPVIAMAQDPDDQADRVSNDAPERPLQMPPASGEVKEALEDFERFRDRNAWERALKALYSIPEDQAQRFVDGEDGFIVTFARKRRDLLVSLPPEGQTAYRLFYDAEAETLFRKAAGASELETLERIYSAYFPTSIGDEAADRLGDLYFELGRFDRAADCWLAVLRGRPDTELSQATLAVKAGLALARAGRRSELAELEKELAGRFANDEVMLGGKSGPASEMLKEVLVGVGPEDASTSESTETGPELDLMEGAVWQVRFSDSVVAGMTPVERDQWESNGLSATVPAVAVDGGRLFANYLGHEFAVDLESGKMLWRSEPFHHVETAAMQPVARMIDTSRFAVLAEEGRVWTLGRNLSDQNFMASFALTCRRADLGDVLWRSSDLADYADFDLIGSPLLVDDTLFIAAKSMGGNSGQPPAQYVLAIRPADGKLLWKSEVGMLRQGQRYYYYGQSSQEPQPQILYRSGALYVDTHIGVLARLDAASGDVDWGFGYPTEAAQGQPRFIIFNGYAVPADPRTTTSPPLSVGETLLVKGAKSDRLNALDPDRMTRLWERPIARSSRLLRVDEDGRTIFLGGPEIDALELDSRGLAWSAHVPGGSSDSRILLRPNGIWQLTSRGIFEIDPKSGAIRRIFRGDDTGAAGGDLFLTDRLLLAVSNRMISAYARPAPPGEAVGADIEEASDE